MVAPRGVPMITPSHLSLMATDAPIHPPMVSDEVAMSPQANALNMIYLSSGEDKIPQLATIPGLLTSPGPGSADTRPFPQAIHSRGGTEQSQGVTRASASVGPTAFGLRGR